MNSSQLQKPLKPFTTCVAMRTKEHQSWLQNWALSISASGEQKYRSQVLVVGRKVFLGEVRVSLLLKGNAFVGYSENILIAEYVKMWSESSSQNCASFECLMRTQVLAFTDSLSSLCHRMCFSLPLDKDDRLLCLPSKAFLAIDVFGFFFPPLISMK